ncbi:hypothetical protein SBA6_140017 [Candidatus Sulfopaludibacter sp. SbA6]|nr:hypothetical protein SBA6_140017 [Candidatus Sulfopaludibacter sp. SbA6]
MPLLSLCSDTSNSVDQRHESLDVDRLNRTLRWHRYDLPHCGRADNHVAAATAKPLPRSHNRDDTSPDIT